MGGQYPSGHEWNFYCDGAAASFAVANWPTPIVFTGYEIGDPIRSGFTLSSKTPVSNPVRKAYEIVLGVGGGRSSWDLTAALYACKGLAAYWDIHATGHNTVDNAGNNQWIEQSQTGMDHSYLVAKMSTSTIGAILDSILVLPPRGDTQTQDRMIPNKRSRLVRLNNQIKIAYTNSFLTNRKAIQGSLSADLFDMKGNRIDKQTPALRMVILRENRQQ
jgi:hypothetical protein